MNYWKILGEFIVSDVAKRVAHLRAKIEINSKTRDEENRRRRRFTARGVSRRLIKTESTLPPGRNAMSHGSNTMVFPKRRPSSFVHKRRVRETGLRQIIIPFQVNVLYLHYVGSTSNYTVPRISDSQLRDDYHISDASHLGT